MSDVEEAVAIIRDAAQAHSHKAHELRALAFKILEPPEGVRVEIDDRGWPLSFTVRFVGPTVDLRKTA